MKKLLSVLSVCSCIVGGTVGTALASDDVNKTVESTNAVWNATFNRGDSDALAQLYAENATLSPGNGQILVGRQAIAGLFQSFFDNGVTNHSIEKIEIYQNNNQIVQLGNWRAEAVNDKQETISFGGVLMTVLEQNAAGEWKTQSHVWNMAN